MAAQAIVPAEAFAPVEGGGKDFETAGAVIRMHPFGPSVAQFLFEGAACERQPGPIEVVAFLVGAGGPDQILAGVRQGAVLKFALAQCPGFKLLQLHHQGHLPPVGLGDFLLQCAHHRLRVGQFLR